MGMAPIMPGIAYDGVVTMPSRHLVDDTVAAPQAILLSGEPMVRMMNGQ